MIEISEVLKYFIKKYSIIDKFSKSMSQKINILNINYKENIILY